MVSYLPSSNTSNTPVIQCSDPIDRKDPVLNDIIPWDSNQAYDCKEVVNRIVDTGTFFEIMPDFAKNIVIGLARMNGQTVSIVSNQPLSHQVSWI